MNTLLLLFTLLSFGSCLAKETNTFVAVQAAVPCVGWQMVQTDVAYKVVGVKDGDTFVVLVNNQQLTVRFAHIDCPEKGQPFGTKAKQYVSDASFGKFVTLLHTNNYDRNGRLIAEVILPNGKNLNKELVREGLAWHFKKYSKDPAYTELELSARSQKIGLWSEPNPVCPGDWRKFKKTRKPLY